MGVDLNSNIDNYIDSKTMIVHMNRYKNVKARGSYTFNLHDWCEEACDVMDIFITKRRDMGYPDDFLFFSKKLKRINASNANKILYDVFGAKNSCNVLRKMFSSNINNIFKGRLTKEILHEIHTIMAHTEDTSKQHYEFKEAEM